jgi:hypothetical protein
MTYGPGQKDILNVNEFDKYFQKVWVWSCH